MNTEAFYIVLNYLAAFSLVALTISILLHPIREQFHKSVAVLSLTLGISYWLKSFAIERASELYAHLATFGFALYFIISLYTIVVFRYFKFSALTRKDTLVLRLIFYGAASSVIFYLSHYLNSRAIISLDIGVYSGLLIIALVHFISKIYFSIDGDSITSEARTNAYALLFSFATSGVLFLGGVTIINGLQFYLSSGVIYSCLLIFSSLHIQVSSTQERALANYINALAAFSKKSLPGFIKEVSQSGFFKKVELIKSSEVEFLDCMDVYSILKPGVVYDSRVIESQVQTKNLSGLLAVRSLLKSKNSQALCLLGKSDSILLVTQVPFSSIYIFNSLVLFISQSIEMNTPDGVSQDNVISLHRDKDLDNF